MELPENETEKGRSRVFLMVVEVSVEGESSKYNNTEPPKSED
jgi:hypothetical protein